MPQINGKQIKALTITNSQISASAAIALSKLAEAVIQADGGQAFTAAQSMGSNKLTNLANGTDSTDAVNKGQLDAAVAGLSWLEPVHVRTYIGNRTVAEINALSPSAGWAVVATGATGTPTAGTSDELDEGDIAEFDGTSWKIIVGHSSNYPPDGTRAIVSESETLYSPATDGTDDGKIAEWDGTSLTPSFITVTDGEAALVRGEACVFENYGYVFDGTVPTGSWTQFTAITSAGAGAGLVENGSDLDVGDAGKGVQVNADNVQVDASEIAGNGLAQTAGGGNEHLLTIDIDSETGGNIQGVNVTSNGVGVDIAAIAGTGIEADGSANLRLAAQGNGIDGGAGATLSVKNDGTSVLVAAGGIKAPVSTQSYKNLTANVTSSDGDKATDTTIATAALPKGDCDVAVYVNGVKMYVSDDNSGECYFGQGDTTTARDKTNLANGDTLRWNGSVAGYELAATDKIDIVLDTHV